MADSSITARIGGDASGLVAALETGKQAAAKFGDDFQRVLTKKLDFKDILKGVFQGIGIASVGAIADKIVEPFREAADSANKIASATERAANATERLIKLRQDDNQQLATAVKEYERLQKEAENLANSKPSQTYLGFIGRGSAADVLFGFSRREDQKRQEAIVETNARAQEKAVEVAERKAVITKKSSDDELRGIKEVQSEDEKRAIAIRKLEEFKEEKRRSALSDEDKLNALEKDRRGVTAEIAKYEKFTKDGGTLTALGTEELLALKNKQLEIEQKIAAATTKKKDTEAEINDLERKRIKLLEDEKNSHASIVGVLNGRALTEASDAELQEKLRRNQAESFRIAGDPFKQGSIGSNLERARLDSESINISNELKFRSGLRRTVSTLGVDAARRGFGGDSLQFDSVLQRVMQGTTQNDRLATDIKELVDIFKNGKATVRAVTTPAIPGQTGP